MARREPIVSLGYPDERITDKHSSLVDFTTNKIGGKLVWDPDVQLSPSCSICGLNLVLVVQLYAPLDNSPYHRSLVVYACINSQCWNQSKSWKCIRYQTLDPNYSFPKNNTQNDSLTNASNQWCVHSEDWGSDNDDEGGGDDENGNLATEINGLSITNTSKEENMATSISSPLGAMGCAISPMATAEIEGDEGEVVEVESPVIANVNVVSLLQNVVPVPQVSSQNFEFAPYFLNFEEEGFDSSPDNLSDHITILLQNYQKANPLDNALSSSGNSASGENYEKVVPVHGDKIFHRFITRLRWNPSQVVRYCRDNLGILWMQSGEHVGTRCKYCNGSVIFEVQILSTLIPFLSLQLSSSGSGVSGHLEYGCVYIFSCSSNCWKPGDVWREEQVLVQAEMY